MNDDNAEIVAKKIVSVFEETLVADGKASKTIESYTVDIRGLIEWLESKGNIFDYDMSKSVAKYRIQQYKSYIDNLQNNDDDDDDDEIEVNVTKKFYKNRLRFKEYHMFWWMKYYLNLSLYMI